jgi:aspartate/methionine/tyrosine aminotransferase
MRECAFRRIITVQSIGDGNELAKNLPREWLDCSGLDCVAVLRSHNSGRAILTSASSSIAAPRLRLVADASFFDAPTYSAWVRGTIRAAEAQPGSAILFSSSISEPTDELVTLLREAFSESLTSRYTSVFSDGNRYVADAICARYGVRPEQVVTTTGVTSALAMVMKALVGFGDHVLIERPGFDLLSAIAREAGAQVDHVERAAPDFRIDLNALTRQITPQTRVVVVTNLHNPTGARLLPEEILAVASIAGSAGAVLLVDEVYADFMRPHVTAPSALLAPNIVSANSLTKVFGLHALKCGWMIGAPDLLARIQNDASDGDYGISKLSHAVAAHVLESAQLFDRRWQRILHATRPVLYTHVRRMIADKLIEGDVPEYGCMYFPKIVGQEDTRALARLLWDRHGILIAPGEYFGMKGHMRIGFGGDAAELDEGLTRLHRALLEMRA